MPRWALSFLCATLSVALCGAQVVQWDLERRHTTHRVSKRSENSTFEEVIANNKGEGGYFATVTIGSPGQALIMQLDTASSDSWVPYSGAPICEVISAGCDLGSCKSTFLFLLRSLLINEQSTHTARNRSRRSQRIGLKYPISTLASLTAITSKTALR